MSTETENKEYFNYKGKPLVASGNMLYYGNPNDKYILVLQINDSKKVSNLDVPTNVNMSLALTDPKIPIFERIIKSTQKNSISSALDVGIVWLERALKE